MNNPSSVSVSLGHLPETILKHAMGSTLNTSNGANKAIFFAELEDLSLCAVRLDGDMLDMLDMVTARNFQHGTSVFATGQAALESTRIILARAGFPKDELDRLSTEHVSIQMANIS